MPSHHHILYALIVCVLAQHVLSQETSELAEEYIDEDLPESAADPNSPSLTAKPKNESTNELNGHKKTNFTDDRFTKLFQPRRGRPQPAVLFPKFNAKAKPTLPPFIKNTPSIVKAQPITQPPQPAQRFNQRSVATTQRTTTTRTPARGGSSQANSNRRGGIGGRGVQSTTASPSTTTDSASRRRFGGGVGGNRRFNVNSTIPATSRPKRF
ncbi:unnamed protein product [Oppiella nova]|uniref:Uncharacterized protein n=1 Tax=Oppiella nova TaxID=334625 RepID=A0A7R9M2C5_9ACAR|nr:unnamed protein product [Oppiella nova]CAG2169447.1 unnamed protein product [Oppiella nova]